MRGWDRDQVRRRERWAERHHGHDVRRNASGAARCQTCYRAGRRCAQPDDGIVDEVVIARLLAGREAAPTVRERAVAAHRMDAAGVPRNEIGRRLRLSGTALAEILGTPEPGETFETEPETDRPDDHLGDVELAVAA